jgi:hypothetical protein
MKIPNIPTNKQRYFLQYLTIINPIVLRLSPMQLKVLAGLLYYNYEYRMHSVELRNKLLSSAATKKSVRDFINESYMDKESVPISEGNFNNLMKELRKKKIVAGKGKDIIINSVYLISPEKDTNLSINWEVK